MNTPNVASVGGGRCGAPPIGAGGGTPCNGMRTTSPAYTPPATGAPKKSWTLYTAYRSPRRSTPVSVTGTVSCRDQLYTTMFARPASYALGRTNTAACGGGAASPRFVVSNGWAVSSSATTGRAPGPY